MLGERDRGRNLDSSKQTLNEFLDRWLQLAPNRGLSQQFCSWDGGPTSVFRRPFDMIDHENFHRTLGGYQFKAKLLLESRENRWTGRLRR